MLSSLLFTFASSFTVIGIAMEMGIVLAAFLMVAGKVYQMYKKMNSFDGILTLYQY